MVYNIVFWQIIIRFVFESRERTPKSGQICKFNCFNLCVFILAIFSVNRESLKYKNAREISPVHIIIGNSLKILE